MSHPSPAAKQRKRLDQLGFRSAGVTGTEEFVHLVLDDEISAWRGLVRNHGLRRGIR